MSIFRLAFVGLMVSPFATDPLLARRVFGRIARAQQTRHVIDEVTGALMIDGQVVVELLEGSREAVTAAFLRSAMEQARCATMLIGMDTGPDRLFRDFEFADLSAAGIARPRSAKEWTLFEVLRVASLVTNDIAVFDVAAE